MRLARTLVLDAARETSPAVDPPLSAPSISTDRLVAYFDSLGLSHLLYATGLGEGLPDAGAAAPVFPRGSLALVMEAVKQAMPIWIWDVETGEASIHRWEESS
jgi:hypothetical protein